MTTIKFTPLITSSTGTTWVSATNISPINSINVLNATGTTLEFRYGSDPTATFQLPTNLAWKFEGVTNGNQLQFRRADTSNTPVTAYAECSLAYS